MKKRLTSLVVAILIAAALATPVPAYASSTESTTIESTTIEQTLIEPVPQSDDGDEKTELPEEQSDVNDKNTDDTADDKASDDNKDKTKETGKAKKKSAESTDKKLKWVSKSYKNSSEYDIKSKWNISSGITFKAFMDFRTITRKGTGQYKIRTMSDTSSSGLRVCNNRYLIAIGTAYNASVGTYVDVKMSDGSVIPCLVGDIKSDKDTDASHKYAKNGSALEFIVDTNALPGAVTYHGDVSKIGGAISNKAVELVVYRKNALG